MLEDSKEREIPSVQFNFGIEEKSEEEIKQKIEELKKRSDEIYASMMNKKQTNSESEIDSGYTRQSR